MTMLRRHPVSAAMTGLIAAAMALCLWSFIASCRNVEFTVFHADRASTPDGCKYLVFTSAGVFENVNSLIDGKTNSAEIYGRLHSGDRYTAYVRGWRVGLLSSYPNLLSVEVKR
jgi:hypothetical protein